MDHIISIFLYYLAVRVQQDPCDLEPVVLRNKVREILQPTDFNKSPVVCNRSGAAVAAHL